MQIAVLFAVLLTYFTLRKRMGRRPTLTSLGVVYFASWSIIGGIRVLNKCLRSGGEAVQFDDTDLVCVGFGIISMVWISAAEIWRHLGTRSEESDTSGGQPPGRVPSDQLR